MTRSLSDRFVEELTSDSQLSQLFTSIPDDLLKIFNNGVLSDETFNPHRSLFETLTANDLKPIILILRAIIRRINQYSSEPLGFWQNLQENDIDFKKLILISFAYVQYFPRHRSERTLYAIELYFLLLQIPSNTAVFNPSILRVHMNFIKTWADVISKTAAQGDTTVVSSLDDTTHDDDGDHDASDDSDHEDPSNDGKSKMTKKRGGAQQSRKKPARRCHTKALSAKHGRDNGEAEHHDDMSDMGDDDDDDGDGDDNDGKTQQYDPFQTAGNTSITSQDQRWMLTPGACSHFSILLQYTGQFLIPRLITSPTQPWSILAMPEKLTQYIATNPSISENTSQSSAIDDDHDDNHRGLDEVHRRYRSTTYFHDLTAFADTLIHTFETYLDVIKAYHAVLHSRHEFFSSKHTSILGMIQHEVIPIMLKLCTIDLHGSGCFAAGVLFKLLLPIITLKKTYIVQGRPQPAALETQSVALHLVTSLSVLSTTDQQRVATLLAEYPKYSSLEAVMEAYESFRERFETDKRKKGLYNNLLQDEDDSGVHSNGMNTNDGDSDDAALDMSEDSDDDDDDDGNLLGRRTSSKRSKYSGVNKKSEYYLEYLAVKSLVQSIGVTLSHSIQVFTKLLIVECGDRAPIRRSVIYCMRVILYYYPHITLDVMQYLLTLGRVVKPQYRSLALDFAYELITIVTRLDVQANEDESSSLSTTTTATATASGSGASLDEIELARYHPVNLSHPTCFQGGYFNSETNSYTPFVDTLPQHSAAGRNSRVIDDNDDESDHDFTQNTHNDTSHRIMMIDPMDTTGLFYYTYSPLSMIANASMCPPDKMPHVLQKHVGAEVLSRSRSIKRGQRSHQADLTNDSSRRSNGALPIFASTEGLQDRKLPAMVRRLIELVSPVFVEIDDSEFSHINTNTTTPFLNHVELLVGLIISRMDDKVPAIRNKSIGFLNDLVLKCYEHRNAPVGMVFFRVLLTIGMQCYQDPHGNSIAVPTTGGKTVTSSDAQEKAFATPMKKRSHTSSTTPHVLQTPSTSSSLSVKDNMEYDADGQPCDVPLVLLGIRWLITSSVLRTADERAVIRCASYTLLYRMIQFSVDILRLGRAHHYSTLGHSRHQGYQGGVQHSIATPTTRQHTAQAALESETTHSISGGDYPSPSSQDIPCIYMLLDTSVYKALYDGAFDQSISMRKLALQYLTALVVENTQQQLQVLTPRSQGTTTTRRAATSATNYTGNILSESELDEITMSSYKLREIPSLLRYLWSNGVLPLFVDVDVTVQNAVINDAGAVIIPVVERYLDELHSTNALAKKTHMEQLKPTKRRKNAKKSATAMDDSEEITYHLTTPQDTTLLDQLEQEMADIVCNPTQYAFMSKVWIHLLCKSKQQQQFIRLANKVIATSPAFDTLWLLPLQVSLLAPQALEPHLILGRLLQVLDALKSTPHSNNNNNNNSSSSHMNNMNDDEMNIARNQICLTNLCLILTNIFATSTLAATNQAKLPLYETSAVDIPSFSATQRNEWFTKSTDDVYINLFPYHTESVVSRSSSSATSVTGGNSSTSSSSSSRRQSSRDVYPVYTATAVKYIFDQLLEILHHIPFHHQCIHAILCAAFSAEVFIRQYNDYITKNHPNGYSLVELPQIPWQEDLIQTCYRRIQQRFVSMQQYSEQIARYLYIIGEIVLNTDTIHLEEDCLLLIQSLLPPALSPSLVFSLAGEMAPAAATANYSTIHKEDPIKMDPEGSSIPEPLTMSSQFLDIPSTSGLELSLNQKLDYIEQEPTRLVVPDDIRVEAFTCLGKCMLKNLPLAKKFMTIFLRELVNAPKLSPMDGEASRSMVPMGGNDVINTVKSPNRLNIPPITPQRPPTTPFEARHSESLQQQVKYQEDIQNKSSPYCVRNNILLILCDLCRNHTLLVDAHIPSICNALLDQELIIRRHTLLVLSQLLSEDFIKPRPNIIFKIATRFNDPSREIRVMCQEIMNGIIRQQMTRSTMNNNQGNASKRVGLWLMYTVNALNNCRLINKIEVHDNDDYDFHYSHQDRGSQDDHDNHHHNSGIKLDSQRHGQDRSTDDGGDHLFALPGAEHHQQRMNIYSNIIRLCDDGFRFAIQAKLSITTLDGLLQGTIPLLSTQDIRQMQHARQQLAAESQLTDTNPDGLNMFDDLEQSVGGVVSRIINQRKRHHQQQMMLLQPHNNSSEHEMNLVMTQYNYTTSEKERIYQALIDTFQILQMPELTFSTKTSSTSSGALSSSTSSSSTDAGISTTTSAGGSGSGTGNTLMGGDEVQKMAQARTKLLTKMARKHILEVVYPKLVEVKRLLETQHHPLLGVISNYFCWIYFNNKADIDATLSDASHKEQLEFELNRWKSRRNNGQQQSMGGIPDVSTQFTSQQQQQPPQQTTTSLGRLTSPPPPPHAQQQPQSPIVKAEQQPSQSISPDEPTSPSSDSTPMQALTPSVPQAGLKRNSKQSRRLSSIDPEDDDNDDDDDDEDEDDPVVRPTRRRSGNPTPETKQEEEDNNSSSSDEDTAEEAAPKPKRGPKKTSTQQRKQPTRRPVKKAKH